MAHLEVEPKPSRPWWVWALLIAVLIALAAMLLRKCDAGHSDANRAAAADNTSSLIASTGPDWNKVDFNSPAASWFYQNPKLNLFNIK